MVIRQSATSLVPTSCEHPSYATAYENLGDVYAKLASQAYDKALRVGHAKTQQYLREPDGKLLSFIFRGLNDLVAMDEEFGDGARLLFRWQPSLTEAEIQNCVTPREFLRAIQAEVGDGSETIQ